MPSLPRHPGAAPGTTVGEWIRQAADRTPDRTCFIEVGAGPERSFAEVNARVNRLVSSLRADGIGRGDRIAVLSVDLPEYVETLLAIMKLGATYVPLNYRLTTRDLTSQCGRAGAVAIFHSDRYRHVAHEIADATPSVRRTIVYRGADGDDGVTDARAAYTQLLADGDESEPAVVSNDGDLLGLAFTSGTTGLPKGVMQSQHMIKHMVMNILVDYRARSGEVRYAAAPLFHISGMAMTLMNVAIGSTSVIAPQFEADSTLRLLAEDRLDACFLVPTMISSVLAIPEAAHHDYERLQLMMYGASPMSPALLRRADATFGCDFLNAFGAGTEAGLQTVLTPDDHRLAMSGAEHLLGSIGRPATGVSLRIVDAGLRDVAPGHVGEIATRSDSVMDGYLDMAERTAYALAEGWFRAGDLAHRDADGYLYLSGRADDMIIRGGENLHPLEIEHVVAEHPAIDQVVVVGAPDDHWGQVVHAHVTLRVDAQLDIDDITRHCRERLAAYKVPRAFWVVDAFPLNASGKVLRRELRPPTDAADSAADVESRSDQRRHDHEDQ